MLGTSASFFNDLETKKLTMLDKFSSFFNKLETKRELCLITPLLFLMSSKGEKNAQGGLLIF